MFAPSVVTKRVSRVCESADIKVGVSVGLKSVGVKEDVPVQTRPSPVTAPLALCSVDVDDRGGKVAFSCPAVKLKALSKTSVSFETMCVTFTWSELALLRQIVFPKYVNINVHRSAAMLGNRRAVTLVSRK